MRQRDLQETWLQGIGVSPLDRAAYYLQDSDIKETAVVRGNSTKDIFMLAIPTFFDLIATVLMNIGLLSVTASVYQMMRGAEMLFAALFAVSFLNRSLNRFHMLGILCCVVGATSQLQTHCCTALLLLTRHCIVILPVYQDMLA